MWSGSGCNTRDKTSDNNHTNNKTDATSNDVIPSLIASEHSDLMVDCLFLALIFPFSWTEPYSLYQFATAEPPDIQFCLVWAEILKSVAGYVVCD